MEVPLLGIELELELPSYATATAMHDQSYMTLHHSSWQLWNFNQMSTARYHTHVLTDSSCVHYLGAMTGTPSISFLLWFEEH